MTFKDRRGVPSYQTPETSDEDEYSRSLTYDFTPSLSVTSKTVGLGPTESSSDRGYPLIVAAL